MKAEEEGEGGPSASRGEPAILPVDSTSTPRLGRSSGLLTQSGPPPLSSPGDCLQLWPMKSTDTVGGG